LAVEFGPMGAVAFSVAVFAGADAGAGRSPDAVVATVAATAAGGGPASGSAMAAASL
jgi:hypothetical protein